jgi:hypothetical protein
LLRPVNTSGEMIMQKPCVKVDYKERYEKLCDDIKQQSIDIRRAFNTDDCTSGAVRTTTGIYDRLVDKS